MAGRHGLRAEWGKGLSPGSLRRGIGCSGWQLKAGRRFRHRLHAPVRALPWALIPPRVLPERPAPGAGGRGAIERRARAHGPRPRHRLLLALLHHLPAPATASEKLSVSTAPPPAACRAGAAQARARRPGGSLPSTRGSKEGGGRTFSRASRIVSSARTCGRTGPASDLRGRHGSCRRGRGARAAAPRPRARAPYLAVAAPHRLLAAPQPRLALLPPARPRA